MKVPPLLIVTVRVFGSKVLVLHALTLIIDNCSVQVTYCAVPVLPTPDCQVSQQVKYGLQELEPPAPQQLLIFGPSGHTVSVEGQVVSVGIPATGTTANGPRLSTDSTRSSAIKEEQAIRLWM